MTGPESAPDSAVEPAAARPVPGPPRRPTPRPPAARPPAVPPASVVTEVQSPAAPAPSEVEVAAREWGRVGEDGTVFVRTTAGERPVGQMPDATPPEALAFFTRRYADLVFEVELLERRVQAGALAPDEATGSVKKVRAAVHGAQAVGDLDALLARLDALTGLIGEQREQRRAERARKLEQSRAAKERIVEEAERLGQGNDWRNGAVRLRQLLDEWKVLPRLDKAVDDALWRRFSTARTTYTRRRKSHFSELNEQRESSRTVKERLAAEAEALSGSTEWGPTAGRYRDLMRQWKAAGPAPKDDDDRLWARFRGAQDAFFGARDASSAQLDQELAGNAEKKESLLLEAEALLPVTDLRAAKEAFRAIADRWDAAGKVPRERMKDLEGRMRRVEQAIRGTEDDQWRRSNPEARARAAAAVAQLEAGLADLEAKRAAAAAAGDTRRAGEHAAAIEARQSWLTEARRALDEFSG
ncbi:MAG TPA: DUF349 domain-containing protein [Nocardioidaceae bacterium]|nr:DUF349 domain-containing protein [Nocardioidaceae bacterium]